MLTQADARSAQGFQWMFYPQAARWQSVADGHGGLLQLGEAIHFRKRSEESCGLHTIFERSGRYADVNLQPSGDIVQAGTALRLFLHVKARILPQGRHSPGK